jgi:hypothetical protein
VDKAIHAFLNGMNVKKLCRKFKVTPVKLYQALIKAGHEIRRKPPAVILNEPVTITRRNRRWLFSSRNPVYVEWRTAVVEHCAYQCQLCGTCKSSRLHAHHIKKKSTHPELAFDPMNGIALCKRCHFKIVDEHEEIFESIFETAIAADQLVPYSIFVWFNDVIMKVQPRLCDCGCGNVTNFSQGKYKTFIFGHRRGVGRGTDLPRREHART